MKTIEYNGKEKKVSRVIFEEYPEIGYSYLQKLFRKSDIKINGKRIKQDVLIHAGDKINIYDSIQYELTFSPFVLYEDENIVAFFKGKKTKSQGENSFESKVHQAINKNYILCHRLDTNTEGVLLFAKKTEVFEEIKRAFKNGNVDKYYYALVFGEIQEDGRFFDYIMKDEQKGISFLSKDQKVGSKEAILEYKPIEIRDGCTLVEIKLITGRTHQIRAQMAFHGYPLIGDGKYGKEEINRKYKRKTQQLVAYKIVFHNIQGCLSYLNDVVISINNIEI